MTPDEYARVREMFDAAVALPLSERQGHVEASTLPGALREELLALLAGYEDTGAMQTTLPVPRRAARAEPPLDDPHLGNYRILRELGGGGMGCVYLAIRSDDVFRKTVAVKIIRAGIVQPEYLERFRRERQILAGLDHPNIARILDGGDTGDGRPFYVMEYVAGLPLDGHCERVGADVETKIRLILQVCSAVEYLHENAIVHRDLKPANILVTPDGHAKVLDLGIAGVQTPEGLVGSPGAAGGRTMLLTPGFASPEQIQGSAACKSSDIYSLGVVLYHLLTGRMPFTNASGEPDMAKQLSEDNPRPPSAVATSREGTRPAISPDLDRVVLSALQRDPTRRYAFVRAFRDDLERLLDGRPITAHAPTWSYRAGKAVRRNKLLTGLTASLALALVAASWFGVRMRIDQVRQQTMESAFDKTLKALNTDMDRWSDPTQQVTVPEKTEVVKRAAGLLQDETLRKVAARGDRPQLVKRVVNGVEGVLSRAEGLAGEATPVHKNVSVAFRIVGDFRLVVATTSGGARGEAVRSYEHAAEAAREVSRSDEAWARATLKELAARLGSLGTPMDVTTYLQPPVQSEVAEAAPAQPVPLAPPVLKHAAPVALVDEELRRELLHQLETTALSAKRGRESAAEASARLAAQGQTLRSDVNMRLAQVDMFLDQARDKLTSGELDAAQESLTKANYVLQRVKSELGAS